MSDANNASKTMLRRLAHDSVLDLADQFRDPSHYDASYHMAEMVRNGDSHTARRELLEWLRDQISELRATHASRDDARTILLFYQKTRAMIQRGENMNLTELGWMATMVAPDYGRKSIQFDEWIGSNHFERVLNTKHGKELSFMVGTGGGKTHTMVKIGQAWTSKAPNRHVLHNINQLLVDDHATKWHRVKTLSGLLLSACAILEEQPDAEIVFLFDDPAGTIKSKAGSSNNIEMWNLFRPYKRKLGLSIVYAWQQQDQIFPSIRGSRDGYVSEAKKPDKSRLLVTEYVDETPHKVMVEGIGPIVGASYNSEGVTSVLMDINFQAVVTRLVIADPETQAATIQTLREILDNPDVYTDELRELQGFKSKAAAKAEVQQDRFAEQLVQDVERGLGLAMQCLDKRGQRFTIAGVSAALGLGHRAAERTAAAMNQRLEQDLLDHDNPDFDQTILPLQYRELLARRVAAQ